MSLSVILCLCCCMLSCVDVALHYLERVSQRLTILAEDGRSKLRSPTKTVGVNHFAIRSRSCLIGVLGCRSLEDTPQDVDANR
jgi:hypothetical protein